MGSIDWLFIGMLLVCNIFTYSMDVAWYYWIINNFLCCVVWFYLVYVLPHDSCGGCC